MAFKKSLTSNSESSEIPITTITTIKRRSIWDLFKINEDENLQQTQSFIFDFPALNIWKFAFLIYTLIVCTVYIIDNYNQPPSTFSQISSISWYGITLYAIITYSFTFYNFFNPDQFIHPFPLYIQRILYHSNLVFSFIVCVVYWSLIFPQEGYNDSDSLFIIISMNVCSHLAMLVEMVVTKISFKPIYLIFVVLFTIIYFSLTVLVHKLTGKWLYYFVNYKDYPISTTIFMLSVIIAELIYGLIMMWIHKLRNQAFNRRNIGGHELI